MPLSLASHPHERTRPPFTLHACPGGFPIRETEWYFGLRIRHRHNHRRYLNIPVNVTVGASGVRPRRCAAPRR